MFISLEPYAWLIFCTICCIVNLLLIKETKLSLRALHITILSIWCQAWQLLLLWERRVDSNPSFFVLTIESHMKCCEGFQEERLIVWQRGQVLEAEGMSVSQRRIVLLSASIDDVMWLLTSVTMLGQELQPLFVTSLFYSLIIPITQCSQLSYLCHSALVFMRHLVCWVFCCPVWHIRQMAFPLLSLFGLI